MGKIRRKEADGGEERIEAAIKVGRSRRVLGGAPLVMAREGACGGGWWSVMAA